MISKTRNRVAAAVGAAVLAVMAGSSAAAAPQDGVQPQAVPGRVISRGADGAARTLMCPPEESVMGGGFRVQAPRGSRLDPAPADLLESRPTEDATGWVIAVRKNLLPPGHRGAVRATPADLVLYVVCTQGESTPQG